MSKGARAVGNTVKFPPTHTGELAYPRSIGDQLKRVLNHAKPREPVTIQAGLIARPKLVETCDRDERPRDKK